jgi:ABC-2 type transport system ATP-binding protein
LALVHRPQILFLDEPTVGMDPLARDNFWDIISTLNRSQGVTVFLTTQYLDEADKHASEMALIVGGEIHFAGSIAGFKKMVNPDGDLSLDDSYLKYIKSLNNNSISKNNEE